MASTGLRPMTFLAGAAAALLMMLGAAAAADPAAAIQLAMGSGGGAMVGSFVWNAGVVRIALASPACACDLPVVLAERLGAFKDVNVDFVQPKAGTTPLAALLDDRAEVAAGDVALAFGAAGRDKALQVFVTYERLPGLVLAVAPRARDKIRTPADLDGRTLGIGAPGSASDLLLRAVLAKAHVVPAEVPVMPGLEGMAAAMALENGQVDAAVMGEPAVTLLQGRNHDLRLLADTRGESGTQAVFSADLPGRALYAPQRWVAEHPKETQALVDGVVVALIWIRSHSPEEIAAKLPGDATGPDVALYLTALRSMRPVYSMTGRMDPKGAEALRAAVAGGAAGDTGKSWTNDFAARADARLGLAQDAGE
jgi:NitT/TauT family transport system substrate-binding protein